MKNNKDCELHMWEYWRDDKGYETAAREYYPNIFNRDPVLRDALADYHAAMQLIDMRMAHLLEQSPTNS